MSLPTILALLVFACCVLYAVFYGQDEAVSIEKAANEKSQSGRSVSNEPDSKTPNEHTTPPRRVAHNSIDQRAADT
jgi:hypothetical protein